MGFSTTKHKNNYEGICYGILFFLIVKYIYWFFYRLIESVFLLLNVNLLIIPVILVIIISIFAFWYSRLKEFPKLRAIYFVFCFCLNLIEPILQTKSTIVARISTINVYPHYRLFISICNSLFVIVILTVSFYKYKKTQNDANARYPHI